MVILCHNEHTETDAWKTEHLKMKRMGTMYSPIIIILVVVVVVVIVPLLLLL